MKRIFTILALLMLVVAGCQKNEIMHIGSAIDIIDATIETATDTKASIVPGATDADDVAVVWDNGDAISVFVKKGNTVSNVKYVLDNSTAGTANGKFKVDANETIDLTDATIVAAVYPYTSGATCSTSGTISNMVSTSTILYSKNLKAAPMAAQPDNGNQLSFKNACSLIKVTTSNVPDDYTTLELSSNQSVLAGTYRIYFASGNPTAELVRSDADSKIVSVTGTRNQPVYFPIFAGTYSDLTVKAKKSDDYLIELISPRALTAVRNKVYYTSASMAVAADQAALNEIVNDNTGNVNVELADDMSSITLPATEQTETVSLAFTSENTSISVKEEQQVNAGDNTEVKGNVNLEINTDEPSNCKTLEVILPSSTVSIKGTTTYEVITASTADNTLILGYGVKANKVIVKKGNIRVDKDAKLSAIEFGNEPGDATEVLIIDNGGIIAPDVYTTPGVTVKTASELELRRKLESGEHVDLTEDVVVNGAAINITKAVVLNLGNNKVTYTGNDVLFRIKGESGLLRISSSTNGEIYTEASNPTTTNGNGYVALLSEGGTMAITGGKLSVGTCTVVQVNEGSQLNVSGGTLEAREDLTVNGNPNYYNYGKKYTLNLKGGLGTIIVSGGTFVGYDPSNSAGENPYANFVKKGYSSIYDEVTNTYTVKKGIYNELALQYLLQQGGSATLQADITTSKLDLSNLTTYLTLDLNNHKIITTDSYGVQIKPVGYNISIKNGEIVMTKAGTYETYAAGIKLENGDYTNTKIDLRNVTVTMANTDWAYAVNLPASVTNAYLYLQKCTLEGTIALEIWGDNNDIDLLECNLICNYTTNENYGSSCLALQSTSDYQAQNNDLMIKNCNFLYTGVNNYNKDIVAVYYNESDNNTINFYNNNVCGEGVKSNGLF